MSSEIILTGQHCGAARKLLRLTKADLAAAAGVSDKTIRNFEDGSHRPRRSNLEKIREALERRGIEFYNGNEPGVRLRPSKAVIPP